MLATEKSMNTDWFESAKQAGTKGGEALPGAVTGECWYVLWTHSNSEQLVHQQLAAKGFQLFLPNIDAWRRRETHGVHPGSPRGQCVLRRGGRGGLRLDSPHCDRLDRHPGHLRTDRQHRTLLHHRVLLQRPV